MMTGVAAFFMLRLKKEIGIKEKATR